MNTDQASEEKKDIADKTVNPDYNWDETIRTLVIAVVVVLAMTFRSLFFQPFHIPSSSMKSTLLIGDYIFVSKGSYGYSRYSFPFGFPLFDGRIAEDQPERGDVAVFRLPSNPRIDFIKRVIGLPGDKVQVKDGIIYINGNEVSRKYVDNFIEKQPDGSEKNIRRYVETLPNGRTYHILDENPEGDVDNTGVYEVPAGHYFMMGDNRDNSTDSRYMERVGFVPFENLIGRADRIFFSINEDTRFWEVWKWGSGLRSDRFFQSIQLDEQ